jgi:hypothetical protein
MPGAVLAWMTADDFDCPLDPDAPPVAVGDDVLVRPREHARGLADTT